MRDFCWSVFLFGALGVPAAAQDGVRGPEADWPMYNRDLAGTRYSPLAEINTSNVATLVPA